MSQDNEYQFNGKTKVLEGMAVMWHVRCTGTSWWILHQDPGYCCRERIFLWTKTL